MRIFFWIFLGMYTSITNSNFLVFFLLKYLKFWTPNIYKVVLYTKYDSKLLIILFFFGTFEWFHFHWILTFTKFDFLCFYFFNAFLLQFRRYLLKWKVFLVELKESGWNHEATRDLWFQKKERMELIDWSSLWFLVFLSWKSLYVDCQNKSVDEKYYNNIFIVRKTSGRGDADGGALRALLN